jgi:hypothetical protein
LTALIYKQYYEKDIHKTIMFQLPIDIIELFIASQEGNFVSDVTTVGFEWTYWGEDVVEITSGNYAGQFAMIGLSWINDTQQFLVGKAFAAQASNFSFLTRHSQGVWTGTPEDQYTGLRSLRDIAYAEGNYYVVGYDRETASEPTVFKVKKLDSNFQFLAEYILPIRFYRLCYFNDTAAGENKLAMIGYAEEERTKVYIYDQSFTTSNVIDLSGFVNYIYDICYDSEKDLFYINDYDEALQYQSVKVFDSNWQLTKEYDLSNFTYGHGFVGALLTKITSGDLKGCLAILSGVNAEITIIDPDPGTSLSKLNDLIIEIENSGIHDGIMKSLTKKLHAIIAAVERGNLKAAVNKIEAFKNEVKAQSGKTIPIDLAEQWLNWADEIIQKINSI